MAYSIKSLGYGKVSVVHNNKHIKTFNGDNAPQEVRNFINNQLDQSMSRSNNTQVPTHETAANIYLHMQLDEQINEILSKDSAAGDWIKDFIESDNPMFEGRSKADHKKMALAAYYSKQRDESTEAKPQFTKSSRLRSRGDKEGGVVHAFVSNDTLAKHGISAPNYDSKYGDTHAFDKKDEHGVTHRVHAYISGHDKDSKAQRVSIRSVGKTDNSQAKDFADQLTSHNKVHESTNLGNEAGNLDKPEKTIEVTRKNGNKFTGTIKATGDDYHIVKDKGGKQYTVDHSGNTIHESENLGNEAEFKVTKPGQRWKKAPKQDATGKPEKSLEYADKETSIKEQLVHVDDGRNYGDKPHKDDIKHVENGLKIFNGAHNGSSDKGAFFKFKSKSDAENFGRHVNKSPKRTVSADLSESIEEDQMDITHRSGRKEKAKIHVTGSDYHIVKNKNGTQYTVDKKGNVIHSDNVNEDTGAATVKTSNGVKTINHRNEFSVVLHPEHQEAINKLKDKQEHKFKDETGTRWTASRKGKDIHFNSSDNYNGGLQTHIPASSLKEQVTEGATSGGFDVASSEKKHNILKNKLILAKARRERQGHSSESTAETRLQQQMDQIADHIRGKKPVTEGATITEGKRADRYHIVHKTGEPATLASYADKNSAVKDRDAKYPGTRSSLKEHLSFSNMNFDGEIIIEDIQIDLSESKYEDYFKAMMKKAGITSISDIKSEDAKKEFMDAVDAGYSAKNESILAEEYLRTDMEKKIEIHEKQGHVVSEIKYMIRNGKPQSEFVVTISEGNKKKHIFHSDILS